MFSAAKTSSPSGYNLTNSLRFRDSASAYLSRTPASAGNRKTFTWSGWVKKAKINDGNGDMLFSGRTDDNNRDSFGFSPDAFQIFNVIGGAVTVNLTTTAVYRDPSSWYHMVISVDTTQATASNRVKIYVNGSQVTSFTNSTYPAQNENFSFNNNILNYIAVYGYSTLGGYLDGYLTEINFIDGQALTPSSFGSTNATTGVWQPARYTGTYGTNGFYLNFSDIALTSGSNAGLGKDFSGNGNYWNTNNISVTAGTTYDAMSDVPTLTSATVANYAVMNPLFTGGATLTNGNLSAQSTSAAYKSSVGTITFPTSGKYYLEATIVSNNGSGNNQQMGIADASNTYNFVLDCFYSGSLIRKGVDGVITTGYGTASNGMVIGIAVDATNGKAYLAINNTWIDSSSPTGGTGGYSMTASIQYFAFFLGYNSGVSAYNFGQRPFSYTPPTGFVALNTYNLPSSTVVKGNTVMDATLYTGTGATATITNAAGFKPDLVWVKSRSAATDHKLTDSVRGVQKGLISDTTGAETTDTNGLTAFNSNGWSLGTDTVYNNNAATYVGWQWQAGQGTNTSGTGTGGITSVSYSVSTTAGFSVVIYTGSGSVGTVTHGLGVAPKMIIIKNRGVGTAGNGEWQVYHASLGNTQYLALNTTAAAATATNRWNNTSPTSSVFTVATTGSVNDSSNTYVAYCWAEISGYSKAFSYTGNGSTDGSFVFCGFLPRFILIKRTDTTGDWYMWDTARNTYDVITNTLLANSSAAETSATSIDALSNGFKLRNTTAGFNASGGTYIGMAWATNPFKNSNAF